MTGDELDIKICRLLTLSFISSAAKCFASDVAMEVTTNAVQLFGGAGYTVDFPVERMMRDAKITQIGGKRWVPYEQLAPLQHAPLPVNCCELPCATTPFTTSRTAR